ncbi:glycoside hydrolase family 43 protein [Amniculicola lignicola CBS 123094]|uniref:Arabinan endo-1,5-alpha-L-arabinosidase n=1 Tax=Amniculicola lignicola CBS 123094 TaxID=1392246 RepID=A0A6A5VXM3_9PLEO|nr:glycoside hydrolase family 43 protein [Amniculicola lignicola CBS 123094]
MLRHLVLSLGWIATALITASPIYRRDDVQYPDPEPCTGNCTWIHDPSVIKENGTYYRFSTSGNIAIATAPTMAGPWKYEGALLENGTSIHVVDYQDIWAPDVTKIGSTFYAYYSVSAIGLQNSTIGLATSTSLLPGTWTDHGSINLPTSSQYNLIDPSIFRESSDSPIHFTFGSYWDDIFQATLPANTPPIDLKGRWESGNGEGIQVTNLIRNTTVGEAVVEGAFITISLPYKSSKYYYMFFSSGNCCSDPSAYPGSEYKIMVCRSTSVSGPFHDQSNKNCLTESGGTIIMASHGTVYAPGGQGVLWEEDKKMAVMYYHYIEPGFGYRAEDFKFAWNYLDFGSGWPVVVAASVG